MNTMTEEEQLALAMAESLQIDKQREKEQKDLAEAIKLSNASASVALLREMSSQDKKRITHSKALIHFTVNYWVEKAMNYYCQNPSTTKFVHTRIDGKEMLKVTGPSVKIGTNGHNVLVMGEQPYKLNKPTVINDFRKYTDNKLRENVGILLLDEFAQLLQYEGSFRPARMEVWFYSEKLQYFLLE